MPGTGLINGHRINADTTTGRSHTRTLFLSSFLELAWLKLGLKIEPLALNRAGLFYRPYDLLLPDQQCQITERIQSTDYNRKYHQLTQMTQK